jgi:NTP pyrophosphatase (non-canonical NTP hydrolase)
MNFDEFQSRSKSTAIYPDQGSNYLYPALGLCSEAGEVADRIKRIQRDDNNVVTDAKRQEIASELGDVLWYVAQLATEFGLSLNDVADGNIANLSNRRRNSTLQGFGDR